MQSIRKQIPGNCQRQLQAPKCRSTKGVTAATQENELLFDGTLCDWKAGPVSFQLKEGVSLYHGRAFPVPKVHKETIRKEVERLCKLGVLERQSASEWALPSFIIPNIRSAKQDDNYGASNIVLPCPGS
jgi:hypothetical protein